MNKYLILSLLILGVGNIYPKNPVDDSARDGKRIVLSDWMQFAIDRYWYNAGTYLGLTDTLGPNGPLQPQISGLIYNGVLSSKDLYCRGNLEGLHPDEYVKRLAKKENVELMPLKRAFVLYKMMRDDSPYFGNNDNDTRKNLVEICGYERRGDIASVSGDKGKTSECRELLNRFKKDVFAFCDKEGIDVDELPLYADEEYDDEDKK